MLIENLFLIPIIIFLVGIINKFFLDVKKKSLFESFLFSFKKIV